MSFPIEPFRIKAMEPIHLPSREERESILKKAYFNVFRIPSTSVYIDLLTDSGTSAMSDRQWASLMVGDEAYAQSRSFFRLQEVVQDVMGFPIVIPTHQGRAAEHLLFSVLVSSGDVVPNNMHFDTTRANVEFQGGEALDCVIEEAYDTEVWHPFKGNMDVKKLKYVIEAHGKEKIPLVMMTITNNSAGGQPVAMENIRQVSEVCKHYGIPFFLDAARFAENAYFIQQREEGYRNRTIPEIVKEMFSYVDGCTMSAKKDGLVNIGGFIALRDEHLAQKIQELLILKEGFPTYGGLAGRDLEAMATGLREVLNQEYLHYRIAQVQFLGELLQKFEVPVLKPFGGHAIYLNARQIASHIPQSQFPAQAVVVALYRFGGIRAVEIGSLMFARKNSQGQWEYPRLELVRLAIPRRVYTVSHLHYVAEIARDISRAPEQLKGLRIVYETKFLRHFTAKLEEVA